MFVVTGITGQVGGALARHLLKANLPVRAVVRNAEKGKAWAARGCDVAVADVLDSDALATAFSGASGVFILIPPVFDPSPGFPEARAMLASIRAAIEAARPGKVVALSTVGAQASRPNLLNQLGLTEQSFATLPLPLAFLRAAWFMENFAWDVASAREEGVIRSFLQPLDRAIPMVATTDIGAVAAELLQESWTGKRIVELEGPRPVSPNDAAEAFAALLGRPVHAEPVPRDQWEALFSANGMKNPSPRAQMLDGFNEGWLAFEGGPCEHRTSSTALAEVLTTLVR